jgi:hypothetical protein
MVPSGLGQANSPLNTVNNLTVLERPSLLASLLNPRRDNARCDWQPDADSVPWYLWNSTQPLSRSYDDCNPDVRSYADNQPIFTAGNDPQPQYPPSVLAGQPLRVGDEAGPIEASRGNEANHLCLHLHDYYLAYKPVKVYLYLTRASGLQQQLLPVEQNDLHGPRANIQEPHCLFSQFETPGTLRFTRRKTRDVPWNIPPGYPGGDDYWIYAVLVDISMKLSPTLADIIANPAAHNFQELEALRAGSDNIKRINLEFPPEEV